MWEGEIKRKKAVGGNTKKGERREEKMGKEKERVRKMRGNNSHKAKGCTITNGCESFIGPG